MKLLIDFVPRHIVKSGSEISIDAHSGIIGRVFHKSKIANLSAHRMKQSVHLNRSVDIGKLSEMEEKANIIPKV